MSHMMDAGVLTPFLWGFEGEKLVEFYNRVLGARFHAACVRLRSVEACLWHLAWTLGGYTHMGTQFSSRVDEIQEVVTGNRIWKQ
ncbi:hypothetical protein DFH29DRAFT_953126 [Suillus ampliporus]|nr:hypothetical protein DFH29DRAFT_953126 [Suillus ampliporus]